MSRIAHPPRVVALVLSIATACNPSRAAPHLATDATSNDGRPATDAPTNDASTDAQIDDALTSDAGMDALASDAPTRDASTDAQTGDAPTSDAIMDAPISDASTATTLTVNASPSVLDLHANDTRNVQLTVTNGSNQPLGTPTFQTMGLTLGTMVFISGSCTTPLAPGAVCTATGHFMGTSAGQVTFQVIASASAMTATATLSATIAAACPTNCGPNGTTNCCDSSVVPGGSFYRSYDVAGDGYSGNKWYPATVSDFRLDKYEVTVGRFRAFVNAGMGTQQHPPTAGAGGRTLNNAPNQGGWESTWNASLPPDTAALKADLRCFNSWTDIPGAPGTLQDHEALPLNCITWYEAMAFCIWDGGYLPTVAEWNYAAVGGSEHRAYPWSPDSAPESLDIACANANYNFCVGDVNRVGSRSPKGDGRWGQSDLGGNLAEWTLDWSLPYTNPCNDCATLTGAFAFYRAVRGGALDDHESKIRGAQPSFADPASVFYRYGARCARKR